MKDRFFRGLVAALALMLICFGSLAEVRTTGSVWLRSGPGLDYETIDTVGEGRELVYLGESETDDRGVAWYKVSVGEGTGWISSKFSELVGEDAADNEEEVEEVEETDVTDVTDVTDEAPAPEDAEDTVDADEPDDAQDGGEGEAEAPANGLPSLADVLFGSNAPEETEAPEEAEEPEEAEQADDPLPAPTVELSVYYMSDLVQAVNDIGLISYREVQSEAPYQYYDKNVIVAGNQRVEMIAVYGTGYSVYGVTVGMDAAAARACLNAAGLDYRESMNGFAYEHRATEDSAYANEEGHDSCINVWLDEDDLVTEIDWSTYTG